MKGGRFLMMVLVVALAGASASAAMRYFYNTSGDGLFGTAANWDLGVALAPGDTPSLGIWSPPAVASDDIGFTAASWFIGGGALNVTTPGKTSTSTNSLNVGYYGPGTATLNIGNGGKLVAGGSEAAIGAGGQAGVVNVNDDGTLQTSVRLGVGVQSSGTLNIASGGAVTVADMLVGQNGAGVVNMTGGSLTSAGYIYLNYGSSATMNLSGGNVTATGFIVGLATSGIANLTISGGTLTTPYLGFDGGIGNVNFTPDGTGKIVLLGADLVGYVNYYLGTGQITNAVATYDGTNTTIVSVPEPATMALLGLGVMGLFSRKRKN